jgi:hypothetical protein
MKQFENIDERLESAIGQLFDAVSRKQRQRSALVTEYDSVRAIAHLAAVYIKPVQAKERQFHGTNPFVGFSVVAVYGDLCNIVEVNEEPLEQLRDARVLARDLASQYSNLSEILCTPFLAVDKRLTGAPRTDHESPEVQLRIGTFPLTILCNDRTEAQMLKHAIERGLHGQLRPSGRKSNLTRLPAAEMGADLL